MEENTTPQEQEQPKQTHDELLAHIRDNLKVNDVSEFEAYTKSIADNRTSDIATRLEQSIAETSNIQKNENEKYFDYANRVIKQKMQAVQDLQSKLEELENGKPDIDAIKKDLSLQYESKYLDKEARVKELMDELNGIKTQQELNSLRSLLDKVETDPAHDPALLGAYKDKLLNKYLKSSKKLDDGSRVMIDQLGDILKDESTLRAITLEDQINRDLASYLKKTSEPGLDVKLKDSKKVSNHSDVVAYAMQQISNNGTNALTAIKQFYRTQGKTASGAQRNKDYAALKKALADKK